MNVAVNTRPGYQTTPQAADVRTLVFDVECYRNFFLIVFKCTLSGEVRKFQLSPNVKLDYIGLNDVLTNYRVVGFNSRSYDVPMIQLALEGLSTHELKAASDRIINEGATARKLRDDYCISYPKWNHIDLIDVAPLKASLKIYAGRLHCKKMQDLPIDPNKDVTAGEAGLLTRYCVNDLDNTILLWAELSEQIKLREQLGLEYGQDLRSRSDAQIAEYVIAAEVAKINGTFPQRPENLGGKSYNYAVPPYISYRHPQLRAMLDDVRTAKFRVSHSNGSIEMPKELANRVIKLGCGAYRMGIGGLHSSEKTVRYVAGEDTLLIDRDVASYYPNIILTLGLYPEHMGPAFLEVYQSLVERRLAAKRAGNKVVAESLKITINGSFGKLGSMWSSLYSPNLLIQVTLTGQLALLMLIEMVEEAGIPVISANTDGIVMQCPQQYYGGLLRVVKQWEHLTGFETEETRYRSYHGRDVNNYIAVKESGGWKGKGAYANPWDNPGPNREKLQKNPGTTICIEAAVRLLMDGTPIRETIQGCRDITKFVTVRNVSGGAKKGDEYLGKAVRFYYAKEQRGDIQYSKRRAKVSKSDGAKPLMELPDELPTDINYQWYITETQALLCDIGFGQATLF